MATARELLGVGPQATRHELDAAYAAKRAAYDVERAAELGEEFVAVAEQRQAEFATAYRSLRTGIAAPVELTPAHLRRRDRETIAALAVFVALALLVLLLRNVAVPERTVSAQGADAAALASKPAPNFTLESLDGREISLADLKGKVVLLNFWATWCPPCVREIPRLVRVADKYRDQGLVVLGVNTTFQDDQAKVTQFVREQGITYPILLDVTGEVGQKYTSRLMPTTYIIDQAGKIVHTKVGEVDEQTLEEQVLALLEAGDDSP